MARKRRRGAQPQPQQGPVTLVASNKKPCQPKPENFCEVCMDEKEKQEMFNHNNKCCHSFCSECIGKHIASKIQENITSITCPDVNCETVLEPEFCQALVPQEVFDRWMDVLCESIIVGSQKFYCPFKDCSALIINDGEEVVRESECMNCRRLFCAQCKVPWHGDLSCEDFKKLNEEDADAVVVKLAEKKKWRRCPSCKFYVEKRDGCLHITCRCGFQFCYACGATYTPNHGGCQ
ncbi:Rbr-type e3 ubiquitin transferase [Thalictrum thalictroides]|uniref:RBR-type E3 ubiquitin transferase n=1 Tax=Thalictrum thalictroides TaxID=46969 RepID=A0A7J6UV24_THATH|nr:Rbr-type e3 ubiquitin transferase [Thalictrum thalictroides]